MNAKKWREHGYKTIFRNGNIYLYRPAIKSVIWTKVDSGNWMGYDNVNEEPWICCCLEDLTEELQKEIIRATDDCYCDKGVGLCDFCAGLR